MLKSTKNSLASRVLGADQIPSRGYQATLDSLVVTEDALNQSQKVPVSQMITGVQSMLQAGAQSFVDQSSKRIATSTAGTLAAGYFYSTINGRSPIPDISTDLRSSLGIERIMTQQIVQLQNEFGPNGEPVYGVVNDDRGLVRCVGSWAHASDSFGQYLSTAVVNDYVEITFYGTGLNWLTQAFSANDCRATIDGGTEGSNIFAVTPTNVLGSRKYSMNAVYSVASGLALGVHTVKIRYASTLGLYVCGFEIVNANALGLVNTNPGTGYVNGQKVNMPLASALAYNTGVTGTRGGRIVKYLNTDGTIKQAFTAVDSAFETSTSANHINEEVVRIYHFREFGAGRNPTGSPSARDDFSTDFSSARAAAFTLDDGVTTLIANNAVVQTEILQHGGNSDYIVLTFVGTGLDIVRQDNSTGSATYNFSIDGGSTIALIATGSTSRRTEKIVSGLPYGTHVIRFNRVSSATYALGLVQFIVYQPKKPIIPTAALELCDYNVMADYSLATSIGTAGVVSSGVMRKMCTRETVYVGSSWQPPTINMGLACGFAIYTNFGTDYAEYVFFGTGVNLRMNIGNTTYNFTYSIGVNGGALSGNLSSYTSAFNYTGSGLTYTNSTGTISGTSSGALGSNGGIFSLSGLPLGVHKLRFTVNNAQATYIDAIDVITPIHSYKSNLYADIQSTLSVGSNSLMDSRKTSMVKEILPAQKAWAQAIGVTANPTSSAGFNGMIPVPDMSLTIKTSGGPLAIQYTAAITLDAVGGPSAYVAIRIYVDGTAMSTKYAAAAATSGGVVLLSDAIIAPASAGTHKVDLYWGKGTLGTVMTADGTIRTMNVKEI
jgi:hypothetical protein